MTRTIRVPQVVWEASLPRFIRQLGEGNGHPRVVLDWSACRFMISGAIVAVTARVAAWEAAGVEVEFARHEASEAFGYLQRMNVFAACGHRLPEPFQRHDPGDRFVPIQRIGRRSSPSELGSRVAQVIVGTGGWTDAFRYVQYGVSEIAANVLHHSGGTGYVSAQYYPARDTVRVGIADAGVGIRASFRNSRFDRPGMTDVEAIELALRPGVSSKLEPDGMYGEQRNFGVGLTLLRGLVRAAGGNFLVASGAGCYADGARLHFREEFGFAGTVCAFTFTRSEVDDFAAMLYQAKAEAGLIERRRGDHAEMFQ